jgi:heme oxygenase
MASRVAKALVRLLPKSESAATLAESSANKRGLSLALDGTLREGAHDMRVFGLGFLRSVASTQDYAHFTTGMYHYYHAMEACLDTNPHKAGQLWRQFPELRRADKLRLDLKEIGIVSNHDDVPSASPATAAYIADIRRAAEEEEGVRLLGHLYVRYFADLFGGRALGWPTQLAVQLPQKPHFYTWEQSVERDRRAYIERLYSALNEAGEGMADDGQRERVVEEARVAFRHNAAVYTELPSLNYGAAKGAANIVAGGLRSSLGLRQSATVALKA